MHWLNGDGTVLWANQTEMNVLGYTPEEYIGQPIMNFCPDERELVLEIFKQLGSGNAIADVPVRFRTKASYFCITERTFYVFVFCKLLIYESNKTANSNNENT